jgi:hypothetical protein
MRVSKLVLIPVFSYSFHRYYSNAESCTYAFTTGALIYGSTSLPGDACAFTAVVSVNGSISCPAATAKNISLSSYTGSASCDYSETIYCDYSVITGEGSPGNVNTCPANEQCSTSPAGRRALGIAKNKRVKQWVKKAPAARTSRWTSKAKRVNHFFASKV